MPALQRSAAWLIRSKNARDIAAVTNRGTHTHLCGIWLLSRSIEPGTLLQALSLLPETACRDSNYLADNDAESAADPRTRRCLLRLGVRADAAVLGATTASTQSEERGAAEAPAHVGPRRRVRVWLFGCMEAVIWFIAELRSHGLMSVHPQDLIQQGQVSCSSQQPASKMRV